MAQAVSRWPLTAEARVRARVNPCGICGGQSGTDRFSPSTSVSPANIIPPLLHIHLSPPHAVCDCPYQAAHYHNLGPKLGASLLTRHIGWKQKKKEKNEFSMQHCRERMRGWPDLTGGASDTSVDRLGQTESIRSDIFDSSVTKEFL
jgi:hypothetical protein